MLAEVRLVAGKDLRLELRSKVALGQIVPFGLVVLLLFAFAVDPGRGLLARLAPGLYWVAVLLSALLTVGRSQSVEAVDGVRDSVRLSGLDPAAMFLGKAAAVVVVLGVLEVVLAVGVVVLYGVDLNGAALLVAATISATVAIAAAGTVYGALVAGLGVAESLLPLLVLPALAPVLIAATEATTAALTGAPADGWGWAGLLAVIAALYLIAGAATYGGMLEES